MPTAELNITPSEAVKLYEEKVTRLRLEMSQAQRASQEAFSTRDKALHETTSLQQEKDALINQMATLKEDVQRTKDTLAEHRKNVEASLNKQEAEARMVIDKAQETTDALKLVDQKLRQREAQLQGRIQTLQTELAAILPGVSALVKKITDAVKLLE